MNIAVIGSGISGCAAAWELSRWASVTVFEAEPRLGGHTHTQHIQINGKAFPVDTGFIVFNHRTYPGLRGWFDTLGVETAESDMSFSASLNNGQIEWSGTDLNSVFAQRRNLVSPRFWGMLADIVRFNRDAPRDAHRYRALESGGPSLGDYLDRQGYGKLFLDAYLLPMAGAIWSCPTEQMRAFPMITFTQFCENHGLLNLAQRPQWYTVRNGAHSYITGLRERLVSLGRRVGWLTRHAIDSVTPQSNHTGVPRVVIRGTRTDGPSASAFEKEFDAVVVACHSDQASRLLPSGTPAQAIASKIRYQPNVAFLHTDTSLMPVRRRAWASWNYIHDQHHAASGLNAVSVTYWMNRLQPLPVTTPILVSLNPVRKPAAHTVINRMDYSHPIFDGPAVQAQQALPDIQGQNNIWLAGAWTRYGFHEDGFQSGINAARDLRATFEHQGHAAAIREAA